VYNLSTRGGWYTANGIIVHNCGCTVEEVEDPDSWEPTDEEWEYIRLYLASHESGMDDKATAAAMRANGQGVVNDADKPKTNSGGSGKGGGGGKLPPVPPPDPADEPLWRSRQNALGIETRGEKLTPAEIEFCEQLLGMYPDLGPSSVLEWIARDPTMRPTNDFVWLANQGLVTDLKSPRRVGDDTTWTPASSAIRLIRDTIKKANRQGVVKEHFIVDFGVEDVSAEDLRELSRYNVEQRDTKVSRLWVMIDGNLEEVELEK
jgi:hypothetical protein